MTKICMATKNVQKSISLNKFVLESDSDFGAQNIPTASCLVTALQKPVVMNCVHKEVTRWECRRSTVRRR